MKKKLNEYAWINANTKGALGIIGEAQASPFEGLSMTHRDFFNDKGLKEFMSEREDLS